MLPAGLSIWLGVCGTRTSSGAPLAAGDVGGGGVRGVIGMQVAERMSGQKRNERGRSEEGQAKTRSDIVRHKANREAREGEGEGREESTKQEE